MALLKGKTALVTGASAGIGQSTVRRLSAAGARVICAARSRDRLRVLAEEIDGQAFAVELDVCSKTSVDSLFEQLPSDWHSIVS
jgi:NADP-dependent 3-hydroxy acid dehydrogenase YdfG|tara:strand:- start:38 stop:289 length:252 start_codon:yes stop_codon:yes gene_type:complete